MVPFGRPPLGSQTTRESCSTSMLRPPPTFKDGPPTLARPGFFVWLLKGWYCRPYFLVSQRQPIRIYRVALSSDRSTFGRPLGRPFLEENLVAGLVFGDHTLFLRCSLPAKPTVQISPDSRDTCSPAGKHFLYALPSAAMGPTGTLVGAPRSCNVSFLVCPFSRSLIVCPYPGRSCPPFCDVPDPP